MSSTDPYANTTTVKNILQHVISPKIVSDGNSGYKVKTDLVNVDNVAASGNVTSGSTTTSSIIINAAEAMAGMPVADIRINVNSAPRWEIAHKNPETGGSAGSEFCVHGYDDAGIMTEALNINRTNFSTIVQGSLQVNGTAITAPGAAASVNTLSAGTSMTSPSVTASTTLSAPGTVSVGNNLNFSSTASTGTLTINGKIAFGAGQRVDFATGGNSSFSTNGGGFLRMVDSTGGIGFGDGSTTGGVLVYGPNSVPTTVSGFLGGTTTFGTNSSSLNGNALFNNLQAGIISWTGNSFGTRAITGLNSSSIVNVTPRSSGAVYGGGVYSVDTNSADVLRVYTTNSGSYSFNYFVSRF